MNRDATYFDALAARLLLRAESADLRGEHYEAACWRQRAAKHQAEAETFRQRAPQLVLVHDADAR
jgi:hypothetical protein